VAGGVLGISVAFAFAYWWPRATLLLALALGMLQYAPTRVIGVAPGAFTAIDDLLLVSLGLGLVLGVASRRFSPPGWTTVWLLVWMGAGVVVAAAYGTAIMSVLESYRWMFLPVVTFFACAQFAQEAAFARLVIRLIVVIALIQAAVAVLQAAMTGGIGDQSFGLLGYGGANFLGFIILFAVVLVGVRRPTGLRELLLVGLGSLGVLAAQSRAGIITLPVVLLIVFRRWFNKPVAAVAVVMAVILAVGLVAFAFNESSMTVSGDLSPLKLIEAQFQSPDRGGGRMLPLLQLPDVFGSSPAAWAAGLGPGQYGSAYHQIPSMLQYQYQVANSAWTIIAGEYGLLGLTALLAILGRALWISRRTRGLQNPDWAGQMSRAAVSIVIIAAFGMTVGSFLEYQPASYPFWALLGLIEAAYAVSRRTAGESADEA
jgi:hypothetical protein